MASSVSYEYLPIKKKDLVGMYYPTTQITVIDPLIVTAFDFCSITNNKAVGDGSFKTGIQTNALSGGAMASGRGSQANGKDSFATGYYNVAACTADHSEGILNWSGAVITKSNMTAFDIPNSTITVDSTTNMEVGGILYIASPTAGSTQYYQKTIVAINGLVVTIDDMTGVTASTTSIRCPGSSTSNSGTHTEGRANIAEGLYAHAEGNANVASGASSHAEGVGNVASAIASHSEGNANTASGGYSHAENIGNTASGSYSHAEGYSNYSTGTASHAQGMLNIVGYMKATATITNVVPATGTLVVSNVVGTFAAGDTVYITSSGGTYYPGTIASVAGTTIVVSTKSTLPSSGLLKILARDTSGANDVGHVEGRQNLSIGVYSHAEGNASTASGSTSHAEGYATEASGAVSHSQNVATVAYPYASTAMGSYNKISSGTQTIFSNTNDALIVGNGASSVARSNAFRVNFKGQVYGLSSFNSSGADFAEYFEWADANPSHEDRVARFVKISEASDKIAYADGSVGEEIIGVVSATPTVIGNSFEDTWKEMYLRDSYGRVLLDGSGKFTINPLYNPNTPYVPRSERPEWDTIAIIGRVLVKQDGTCVAGGKCSSGANGIATHSTTGYRILSIISSEVIEILLK